MEVTWADIVGSIVWVGLMALLLIAVFVLVARFFLRRPPEFEGTMPDSEREARERERRGP